MDRFEKRSPGVERRPKMQFHPTREQRERVEKLVGFGVNQADIATVIKDKRTGKPISQSTLKRAFPDEIRTGAVAANEKVAVSLFNRATAASEGKGDVAAQIFWLVNRAGWKNPQRHEISGPGGGKIAVSIADATKR